MQKPHHEHRKDERIQAALPVDLGTAKGITRDINATGLYFETDAEYSPGSPIDLTVEFDAPAGKMLFKCQGEIVRVDRNNARVGGAVKITDSILRYAQD